MRTPAIVLATALVFAPTLVEAQGRCAGRDVPRDSVSALADCLSDPDPEIRDGIAFETLSKLLRSGSVDASTLGSLKDRLLRGALRSRSAMDTSFHALTLAEVARTDRIKPWMTDAERQQMVDAAAHFLNSITDYRAFTQREGFFLRAGRGRKGPGSLTILMGDPLPWTLEPDPALDM